jgi:hypothetical protein
MSGVYLLRTIMLYITLAIGVGLILYAAFSGKPAKDNKAKVKAFFHTTQSKLNQRTRFRLLN